MSGGGIGYVYEFSPYGGATFAVHLALGDIANDLHGWELWMSVKNLADKARVSRKTAGEALVKLEADGFIECLETADPEKLGKLGRPLRYKFLRPVMPVVFDGRVRTEDSPRPDRRKRSEVRTEDAGGESLVLGGCVPGTHELKRTEGERNEDLKPLLDPTDQAVVETEQTVDQRAKRISDGYWQWWKDGHGGEEPIVPFMGIRRVVADCLRAGWPEAEVKRCLAGCGGAISRASMARERSRRPATQRTDPAKAALDSGRFGLPDSVVLPEGGTYRLSPDEVRELAGLPKLGER